MTPCSPLLPHPIWTTREGTLAKPGDPSFTPYVVRMIHRKLLFLSVVLACWAASIPSCQGQRLFLGGFEDKNTRPQELPKKDYNKHVSGACAALMQPFTGSTRTSLEWAASVTAAPLTHATPCCLCPMLYAAATILLIQYKEWSGQAGSHQPDGVRLAALSGRQVRQQCSRWHSTTVCTPFSVFSVVFASMVPGRQAHLMHQQA